MITLEESREILRKFSPTQEKVERAISIVIQFARPSRIFIFGSWARDDARWDSDLDLAILLHAGEEERINDLKRRLHRELETISMSIDLLIATEPYAELMTDPVNGIFHDIFTEGRLVYDARRAAASAGCGSAS